MTEMICHDIMYDYARRIENFSCDGCKPSEKDPHNFKNSDEVLKLAVPMVRENRKEWGLEGLVGGLQAVIINTGPDQLIAASQELMDFTGFDIHASFEGPDMKNMIMKTEGSSDIILRSRKKGTNPFREYNTGPKTKHLPDSRLETFLFKCRDIEKYVEVQQERGVGFLQDGILHLENYDFIQTIPSCFTGNSIGMIQWKGSKGDYRSDSDDDLDTGSVKKDKDYLRNIKHLDHSATRLESQSRDAAIIEFMELTNYRFDFAIYVKNFNSITNVSRLSKDDYAQVFTTGIEPFKTLETSGPTEKFVHNYGPRVHHMAFHTEKIDDTYEALMQDGMEFLLELVGSPDEGLKQTFTKGSRHTFLVNEYIHRFGDFDGFFTKSNVTDLTRATDAQ